MAKQRLTVAALERFAQEIERAAMQHSIDVYRATARLREAMKDAESTRPS